MFELEKNVERVNKAVRNVFWSKNLFLVYVFFGYWVIGAIMAAYPDMEPIPMLAGTIVFVIPPFHFLYHGEQHLKHLKDDMQQALQQATPVRDAAVFDVRLL